MNRAFAVASLTACIACRGSNIDPRTFDAVDASGQALRAEAYTNGAGSSRLDDRLKGFETAIADADRRVRGGREKADSGLRRRGPDISVFPQVSETWTRRDRRDGLLRFNRPVAFRYAIIRRARRRTLGDRKMAMDIFAARAAAELAAASSRAAARHIVGLSWTVTSMLPALLTCVLTSDACHRDHH
jgi:hypothetical protein